MEQRREESRDGSSWEKEASEVIWHQRMSVTSWDDTTCDLERVLTYIPLRIMWISLGKIIDHGWKPTGESYYSNYELQ